MKQIDDNLEWHDENELVRRLDVVEAVLNLADTIDDVVDVIMSVPTYKVQTSTNIAMGSDSISTKADRKTEQTEPQKDNGIGCSRCEGRYDCYDRDMPHAVHCNNYGKITDEPQPEECNRVQFMIAKATL